jgi:hypothetical protein
MLNRSTAKGKTETDMCLQYTLSISVLLLPFDPDDCSQYN